MVGNYLSGIAFLILMFFIFCGFVNNYEEEERKKASGDNNTPSDNDMAIWRSLYVY